MSRPGEFGAEERRFAAAGDDDDMPVADRGDNGMVGLLSWMPARYENNTWMASHVIGIGVLLNRPVLDETADGSALSEPSCGFPHSAVA